MEKIDFLPVETDGETGDGETQNEIRFFEYLAQDDNGQPWNWDDIPSEEFDMDKELPPMQYAFSWCGIDFAPFEGVQAISGQSGHGKTQLMSILMATILGNGYGGIEYHPRPDGKVCVLYVDTEMESANTQRVAKRVCALAGRPYKSYPDFHILRLRETITLEERWKRIAKKIRQYRPTAIFLDGMLDLVADMNNSQQAQFYIFGCMSMAVDLNAVMFCVSHQNPTQPDKIAGHIGSYLERKATDILNVVKEKDGTGRVVFHVTHQKTRQEDMPKMDFYVEKDPQKIGLPRICDPSAEPLIREAPPVPESPQDFENLPFALGREYNTETAIHHLKSYYKITEKKARMLLRDAVSHGVVVVRQHGLAKFYKMATPDPLGGDQSEINFTKTGDDPPF